AAASARVGRIWIDRQRTPANGATPDRRRSERDNSSIPLARYRARRGCRAGATRRSARCWLARHAALPARDRGERLFWCQQDDGLATRTVSSLSQDTLRSVAIF